MTSAKKVLALVVCFLMAIYSLQYALATDDSPAPSVFIDESTPTPTAEEPSPTPTAEEPTPTPTAEEPSPTPTAEEPTPTPTAVEPTPTPTAEEPTPTPTVEETTPTPGVESPESAMTCGFSTLMSAEELALTAVPDTFDLYVTGVNHTDMTLSWPSPSTIYFVDITGLTETEDYVVSGSTVILKTSFLSTLAVGDNDLEFNFVNNLSEPIAVTKAITVVNTEPVDMVSPGTAVFDRDSSSLGYTDLAFTVSGADFVDIQGLTLGTDYTFTGSTVTIRKEYLQTLPLRDKEFIFRFGEGGSVPVSVIVSIIDSRYPPLSVNGTPVTEGSGTGWTYASHVLTITADACTLSGVSDTDSIVIDQSVTSIILSDLRLSTTEENALSFYCNYLKTLTMQLQGSNRLESLGYGIIASGQGDLIVLGSGSLTTSGIYGRDITVRDGTIQINDPVSIYGINAAYGKIIITGGSVTATLQGTSDQYALVANSDIVISGGTIVATADGRNSYPLFSNEGNINISGGSITATSRASGSTTISGHGMHGQNISISGGLINIGVTSTGGTTSSAYGLYAGGNGGSITVSAGSISIDARAESGRDSNIATGIYTANGSSTINIHGGSIHTQTVTSGITNYGLRAYLGNITIDGGTVTTDGYYGLHAEKGNIALNGGIIKTEGSYGLYSKIGSIALSTGTVVANSSVMGLFAPAGITITDSMVAASSVQGTPVIDGSMYFLGANHAYTLQNAATVVDTDMLLPQGSTFTIPAGFTVQLLSGAKLKVAGTLYNNGTILGAVVEADGSPYKVRSITLNTAEAQLESGDELQLTAAALPNYAANRAITWSSSNEAVAKVDEQGLVTTLSPGQAIITATAQDAGGAASSCTLTVIRLASGITLNMSSAVLYTGEDVKLEAAVAPDDASDKTVTWSTSDETIATVDSTGTVTAVKAGSAVITATANDGSGIYASCTVTVKQYATGITLNEDNLTLYLGETYGLTAAVKPDDASDKTVAWTSSDDTIATVGSDGTVTALKIGSAVITATANGGSKIFAQCQITVKKHVTGITLNMSSAVIYTGDTAELDATVMPADASDKTVTWSTSDSTIATVDESGTVTAVKAGSAAIQATANDGSGIYGSCTAIVKQYATGITLNMTEAVLYTGDTLELDAMVMPTDASDKTVDWSISDDTIATVDSDGTVTALKAGDAVVTATANDGSGIHEHCRIIVKQYVTSINLNISATVLYTGEEAELTATVLPEDASDKIFTWTTGNAAVATVNSAGTVTAVKAGSAVIRATASDGSGIYGSCTVTVKQYATGITLNSNSLTLYLNETSGLTADVRPADASDKMVTWSTSDETVAAVNASGTVTALKIGSAVITAAANDGSGVFAQCQVTVKKHVASISLNKNSAVLYTGETMALSATVMPADASDKTFTWTTGNAAVATVNSAGTITAVKAGSAVIRATANDGSGIYGSCTVTVKQRAQGITLSAVSITLYLGKTAALTATVQPADTSDKSVTWATSNGSCVAVDASGTVSGMKEGTAAITVTANDGSGANASCNVKVIKRYAAGITLNASGITLYPGKEAWLYATVTPEDTYDKTLGWSSSNPAVATIDAAGKVVAVYPGTALITAYAADGSGASAACSVTVYEPVAGIALSLTNITIAAGQTVSTVTASVLPANATNKFLKWTSSNTYIATVDANGFITGVQAGTAYITAAALDGSEKTATAAVNVVAVKKGVTGIKLNKSSAAIDEGKTVTISARLTPSSPQNRSILWSSSNPGVASVDGKGKVYGLTPGTVTITATASSGVSAQCTVTVNSLAVSQVVMNKGYLVVDEGKTASLSASVLPKKARFKSVSWSTSDPSVATVSQKGKITTYMPGTVQIIATAHNGVAGICTLVVRSLAVTSISLNKAALSLKTGRTSTLKAKLLPRNTPYKAVTWSSSNPAVATVTSGGKVRAVGSGSATITSISHNGIMASCNVIVP